MMLAACLQNPRNLNLLLIDYPADDEKKNPVVVDIWILFDNNILSITRPPSKYRARSRYAIDGRGWGSQEAL